MIVRKSEIKARLTELPAFPRIVILILETLNDDSANTRTLVEQLSHDPILTGKVLSAANRGSLRLHAAPVLDIHDAITLVGTQRIRELALTASLIDYTDFLARDARFQEHAMAAGICAQELSPYARVNADMALVTSLLHDIGQIWMSHSYPRVMEEVVAQAIEDDQSHRAVERSQFGMCHCEVGEEIARLWGLPTDLCEAIGQHHHSNQSPLPALAALIQAAEAICNGLDLPYREYGEIGTLADDLFEGIHLNPHMDLQDVFGRLEARYRYSRETWQ
jgi:HD-like signal output (HDOD) protein